MEMPQQLSDYDVQRLADAVAEKALKKWATRAVPPASPMSRDELHELMEDSCKAANDQMLVEVRRLFSSIGLDLTDPAETASRVKTLFRLQHNIGVVVLWACISAIGAIIAGVGWAVTAPWRPHP
jgi:hypothetical protein